jgi:hypothetical protein
MTVSATNRGLKPGVCTSSNRPANPFDGMVIYMTDVDQAAVWDGSSWVVLAPITGNRNVIINGDFKVWQRGTAVQSNAGQGAYAADRWCGAHQYQNSRTQRTSISSAPSGLLSQYALRSSSSTTAQVANGTRMRIAQKLESLNSYGLRGQQVTLSFWVRFSNATVSSINNSAGGGSSAYGNFGYSIGSYTSTTDSATNTSAADSATTASITNGSLPTTWTKYTLTGTISSTANNVDVVFGFVSLGSTTSADTEWFELAQIQLEAGAVATPFEFEDYGVTLAKCQRYFQSYLNSRYDLYSQRSGDEVKSATLQFITTFRTTPTVTLVNSSTDGGPAFTVQAYPHCSRVSVTSTSSAQAPYIESWTASAEL